MAILTNPLFYNLLFAHLFADFFLQSEKMCKNKEEDPCCWSMVIHILIVAGCTCICSNAYWDFLKCAIWVIALTHLLFDCIKSSVAQYKVIKKHALFVFLVDQVLHVGVLAFVAYFFRKCHPWNQFNWLSDTWVWKAPAVLCLILVIFKPADIFIKNLLNSLKIRNKKNTHVGRWIGCLERILCVLFFSLGQYEAIGLIVAAKSILRYREHETIKTEYVLLGTLASFSIACISGLAIKFLLRDFISIILK
ncbi:MAG: DUF3307 domain-containing protein [Bacteroidales bacterium]|nr:DUF3307 domain-containing protein [Bacteroidales bacterium]MBP5681478.1 DUF3307 domain-containing protein [Bacteroidales bacterium]